MKLAFLALAAAAAVITLAGCGSAGSPAAAAGTTRAATPSSTPEAIQTVAQPETASQVAASLGASSFTDCGGSAVAGVIDSGTAQHDGERIGIDTFAGMPQRDSWKAEAANLGIVPLYQGTTWVAYKAQSQTGAACS